VFGPEHNSIQEKEERTEMKSLRNHTKTTAVCLFTILLLPTLTFAQGRHSHHDYNDNNVVRWRSIKGVITAPDIDNPVGVVTTQAGNVVTLVNPGISAGTLPWTTTQGSARVNLATGAAAFEVEGLVLNGGNASGTPGRVDQVEGSLVCNPGTTDEAILTTAPVPLSSRGDAEFSGNIGSVPSPCANPLFLVRIGPDFPAAGERWIATGAVRISGDQD
jgi:hypothetical protein